MSVQAISWVLEYSQSELGARLVALSIANHAKADGTGAWPSIKTISQESHLSEREVRYSLRKLEELGELATEVGSGPHGTNIYTLPRVGQILPLGQSATQKEGGGGNLTQGVGQSSAPEPSLTVLKEEPSLETCPACAGNPNFKHNPDCPENPKNRKVVRKRTVVFRRPEEFRPAPREFKSWEDRRDEENRRNADEALARRRSELKSRRAATGTTGVGNVV